MEADKALRVTGLTSFLMAALGAVFSIDPPPVGAGGLRCVSLRDGSWDPDNMSLPPVNLGARGQVFALLRLKIVIRACGGVNGGTEGGY